MDKADEHHAGWRALMRQAYDEAVGRGGIEPLPADLTGWRAGAIVVTGPGSREGCWSVHNPSPGHAPSTDYDVSHEALLAAYARGDLSPPAPAPGRQGCVLRWKGDEVA